MMENTAKLLDHIVALKEYKHQTIKALARIGHWYGRLGEETEPNEARQTERETLETVLRIFKEEAK